MATVTQAASAVWRRLMRLSALTYRSTNKLFDAISRVRPLYFLTTYFLCIPLFALTYWNMPGAFYAPYAKLEQSARSDSQRIANVIESAIQQHLVELENRRQVMNMPVADPREDWQLKSDALYTQQGSVEGNEIRLLLAARLSNRAGDEAVVDVPLVIRAYHISNPKMNDVYIHIDYDYKKISETNGPFRTYLERYHAFRGMPLAQLGASQRQMIAGYIEGYSGDPLGISDSYARMLYFSVVVITTVGFGDIVPMTTAARFWVAVEAIVGVILAGLFINAVASRARGTRSPD